MGSEYNHESLEHLEVWSNAWVKRSSPTPRSRQGSPRSPSLSPSSSYSPFRDGNGILPFVKTGSRLSNAAPASPRHSSRLGWRNFVFQAKGDGQGRRQKRRRVRGISIALGLLALFFLLDWWVLSRLQQEDVNFHREDHIPNKSRWFEVGFFLKMLGHSF